MTVFSPCDATQARLAALAAVEQIKGPVYLRFGRESVPDFTDSGMAFIPGKAQLLLPGTDITLAATGHMVWEALQAALQLQADGISARVINIHTIKPVDEKAIVQAARETGCILTIEEHQINAGLGGIVCETVTAFCPVPVQRIGMNNVFGESGQPAELMEKYGLNARNIYQTAINLLMINQIKNNMSSFVLILQSTLPSLLVLAVAVYFFHASNQRFFQHWKEIQPILQDNKSERLLKAFLDREEKQQLLSIRRDNRKISIPLRLQAYERCVLLMERIGFSSLLLRVARPGMDVQQFQSALLQSIREEFEHNLSQQIYISEDAWTRVRKATEDSIRTINSAMAACQPGDQATILAAVILEAENEGRGPAIPETLEFLRKEVWQIVN
jgi:hypothetical protein